MKRSIARGSRAVSKTSTKLRSSLRRGNKAALEKPCRLFQTADPVPKGLQIFIVKRQFSNVLIKRDGMPQANFRLFHAARDARVAGKAESDHGNFGMYRLRPQQNGFRLPYTLYPSDRIGESDLPGVVFRLNLHKVAGNRCGHIPLFGCHVEVDAGA
jgi:hypothetical protein